MLPLTVSLPLPPSTNRIWRNVKGRTLLSEEARQYLDSVGLLIKGAAQLIGWEAGPGQRYRLAIVLHFPDRRRTDISNRIKLLEDTAAAALGFDDSAVDELYVVRGAVDKMEPRCELTIGVL